MLIILEQVFILFIFAVSGYVLCKIMRIYFVENGESYNLTETITSLSYLFKDYTPGEKVAIDIPPQLHLQSNPVLV